MKQRTRIIRSKHDFFASEYILRYYLPPDEFDSRLDAVIAMCKRVLIERVMFFNTGPELFHTNFQTIKDVTVYSQLVERALRRCESEGIEAGVNIWFTLGHGDYGREACKEMNFHGFVDEMGRQSIGCACPLDPVWQSYIVEIYRTGVLESKGRRYPP